MKTCHDCTDKQVKQWEKKWEAKDIWEQAADIGAQPKSHHPHTMPGKETLDWPKLVALLESHKDKPIEIDVIMDLEDVELGEELEEEVDGTTTCRDVTGATLVWQLATKVWDCMDYRFMCVFCRRKHCATDRHCLATRNTRKAKQMITSRPTHYFVPSLKERRPNPTSQKNTGSR